MHNKFSTFATDYGMLFVLLLLGAFFSGMTIARQNPTGAEAGRQLANRILSQPGSEKHVFIAASASPNDKDFAAQLKNTLQVGGAQVLATVAGGPPDVRKALDEAIAAKDKIDVIATTQTAANWKLLAELGTKMPSLSKTAIMVPTSYWWPNFLKRDNLSNVATQSAIFAIVGIGMTMVIITAGIDLSVGSLVALSAVTVALCLRDLCGGFEAALWGMVFSSVAAVAVCGLAGLCTGLLVTGFGIAPFIVTLAMMSVARGAAKILTDGQNVYQVPKSFSLFAMGRPLGVPNAVILMIVLYAVAHIVMTRTTLGRYLYAVGGNREAARLSGVPVVWVLIFAYTLCGALAGLGGVIQASKLTSGSPLYGTMYELYVIAAVVVGGTSLAGGEGKILNTLIGALIIAVIGNGMNLMKFRDFTQEVVMGLLIIGAVLIDVLRRRGWKIFPTN
ncbi:MAG: ABC transporter permease [Pirellulales bacterium]|jgi:ribose transport system permease protein|nr:ABC transporter permease [Pirellulales bacterium]